MAVSLHDPELFVRKNMEPEERGGYKCGPTMVRQIDFEEYAPKFEHLFHLTKDEKGIVTAQWYTPDPKSEDDSMIWSLTHHRAIWQLLKYLEQDESVECVILGGSGKFWMDGINLEFDEVDYKGWVHYEHMYHDGNRINQALVNLGVPTIGIINGPANHSEMALLCDITLMAEDAFIMDLHYPINIVPGDGIQLALQGTMGVKRANYMMLTGQTPDAKTALEYGMVNEIMPADKLYERAHELAEIMLGCANRVTRHVTTKVLRRPWMEAYASHGWDSFGSEMFATMNACVEGFSEHDNKFFEDKVNAAESGNSQQVLSSVAEADFK